MSRLTKLQIGATGFLESISKCVGRWRPGAQSREIAYSRLLAEYLRQSLPEDAHVECEYRHSGETADVYIRYGGMLFDDEVFIEVKRRLVRKAELNRLVGQVRGLDPGKNKILIVLIGTCDVELLGRLRQQFKEFAGAAYGTVLHEATVSVVEVPESAITE